MVTLATMPVNLTPNAIAAINDGDMNSKPLVQVLDIKLIGSTQERYRLLISDSAASQHAMLATHLNDRVKTGAVKKGSVVQLIDYICSTVQNRKIIVVLNMETILLDCEIIGNPKMFTESESTAQKPMPNANLGNPVRDNNFITLNSSTYSTPTSNYEAFRAPNSSTFNTSNSGTFGGQNPSTFNYGEDVDDHEAGTNASAPLSDPGANVSAPLSKPGANASAPLSEAQVEEANMGADEAVPAGLHDEYEARCPLVAEAREAGPENVTPLSGAAPEAMTISSNPFASSRPGASSGVPSGTFAPCEILEAMTSGRAYVGEDIWSRLRVGDSQRLNNFYNSSVYMVSEMADLLKTNRAQVETIIRLEASLKESEERRLSLEWVCEEKLRVNQETVDSHLAARLKAEQRASVAEENAKSTRDLLLAVQELLQAKHNAEARLSYE